VSKSKFLYSLALVFALTFVIAAGLLRLQSNRTRSEKYMVYSAYVNSRLTGESHDLGSPKRLSVIVGTTIAPGISLLGDAKRRLPGTRPSTLVAFLLSNLWDKSLTREFDISARYLLITKTEALSYPFDSIQKYPSSYGYLIFSDIGLNADSTEALFYTEHICGLCGGGEYVLMQKIAGRWKVVGESYTWIS
jgi:hypothetical protein